MARRVSGNSVDRTPIHKQISDRLRGEILSNQQPGAKFGSQNELARRFGVSHLTVREAVSALVQEGLLERRFGSGTYVADLRARMHIGLLTELDISRPQASYFFIRMTLRIMELLRVQGFNVRPYIGNVTNAMASEDRHALEQVLPELRNGRVAGLILLSTPFSPQLFDDLRARGVPYAGDAGWPQPAFASFQDELVRQGVARLIQAGCKKVAFLEHGGGTSQTANQRKVRDLLTAAGVATRPEWLRAAFAGRNEALQVFRSLWQASQEKPDGLLVLDDVLYRELSPMLLANHIRVPEDLIIVSHGNLGDPLPFIPEPVRVAANPDDCAEAMVNCLLARMAGKPFEQVSIPVCTVEPSGTTLDLKLD